MRTTISIDERVLERAKRAAADRGVTVSVLVEEALNTHLAGRRSAAREPFRLATVRGRLVNPHLDLDRTSALLVEGDIEQFGRD